MKSPIPDNEAERLAAVSAYGDLDTLTDESLDALTRVAATLCNVPIALVSLIDERRQRFISQQGLGDAREMPRELTFCAHTIMKNDLLVVSDARLDDRFRDYSSVTGAPGVRFYVGAPLVDESGFPVGTMCVADTEPRIVSNDTLAALRDLSQTVTRILATRRGARVLQTTVDKGVATFEQNSLLKRSLREKETLLKEIHHRVKNNLQVVGSLLNLHARSVNDDRVRAIFGEVRGRIHAIALLHERLYRSPDLGHIDIADYLHGVAIDAARAAGGIPSNLLFSLESMDIDINTAVPLGLIVNELVTNAFKHGAPAAPSRAVVTVAVRAEGGSVRLRVADNGVGFPAGFQMEDATSMGMLLVRSLARQIHGSVQATRDGDDTRFQLTFAREAEAA